MDHDIQEWKKYIITSLNNEKIKHQVNDFPSGCCMIDIWKGDKFYVIQIEPGSIGVSLVDGMDLSTIPDERYDDFREFSRKFAEILAA